MARIPEAHPPRAESPVHVPLFELRHYIILPAPDPWRSPYISLSQAAHTAAVVNELSVEMARILEAHPIAAERKAAGLNPANCVLLRGCGSRIQV